MVVYAEAVSARDEALALLEKHRADYLAKARVVALELYRKSGKPVTVDMVRAVCPPPSGVDGRVMGAVFNRRDWIKMGTVNSHRRTCHARPISQFVPAEVFG